MSISHLTPIQAFSPARRGIMRALAALAALPLAGAGMAFSTCAAAMENHALAGIAALEKSAGGRLGMALLDAEGKTLLQYRAAERFPMCSTFKMVLASAILKRSVDDSALLSKHIRYDKRALVNHSPETEKHVAEGMSVEALCAAAMTQSDNAAANLLLKEIGGPKALTAYARGIGDQEFLLVHNETALGTAIPGNRSDTSTPLAMARTLQRLALGKVLETPQRVQLLAWLRANTTGVKRVRAGVPAGWEIGDKTGAGDYGTTNDIAVMFRPNQAPLILTLYYTQKHKDAPLADEVLAQATRMVTAPYA